MNTTFLKSIFVMVVSGVLLWTGCSNKNQKPAVAAPVSSADSTAQSDSVKNSMLTYEQRQGKYLYTKYCSVCHGDEGKGDGFNAFNLDPKPRDFTDAKYMNVLDDQRLAETITFGGRGVNRSPLMPSWGGRLNKDQIQYLIAYVRTFSSSK
ncbi:MAG TPA: c-type cytochrome [Bacteroidota bacterium]|nr:c-type cytochrome [Bacteroidota bacterium]